MTGPARPTPRQAWWLRPAVALPVLAAIIAVAAVLTPQQEDARGGDPRLSTHSASPLGARLLYELAERLGWDVRRHLEPQLALDSAATLALLHPVVVPTAAETHAILEHVRQGGALLYVLVEGSPLDDSLGVRRGGGNRADVPPAIAGPVDASCAKATNGAMPLWPGDMFLWHVIWRRSPPQDRVVFAETERPVVLRRDEDPAPTSARGRAEAAVGFALGSGRVVVVADPDLLRNDVLRVCRFGADVAAVRMLEYLSAGRSRTVVFDEFRQGHGRQPGTFAAITTFLSRTREGHALGGLMLAGLVLLIARAPRVVPPRELPRIERRSPLEHVQALARAYEKVGASRTAVLRLLAGVRRRAARQGAPPLADGADAGPLLAWIEHRAPATAADVALVRRSLEARVTARDLVHVAAAVRRIDDALAQRGIPRPPTRTSPLTPMT